MLGPKTVAVSAVPWPIIASTPFHLILQKVVERLGKIELAMLGIFYYYHLRSYDLVEVAHDASL